MAGVALVAGALAAATTALPPATSVASVYLSSDGTLTLKRGVLDAKKAAAWGALRNATVGGWSTLDVGASTANAGGNATRAYAAAGTLEAALTCWHIGEFARNNDDPKSGQHKRVAEFVASSMAWTRANAASNTSNYWAQVGNALAQFDGLVAGYAEHCAGEQGYTPLTPSQMLYMQMDGDLNDLEAAFTDGGVGRRSRAAASAAAATQSHNASGGTSRGLRCSMLAKIAEDKTDLYFGHATWDSFSNMAPRVYKTYHLPVVRRGERLTHTVSFSSSPSWLASIDDWYVTNGTGSLVVIETSHDILNAALYRKLTPTTVFSWLRSIVANALAESGPEWAELFSAYHSGTYNNEWQVIDLSKFKPNSDPEPGLLTIVEEIPGLIHAEDMTSTMVGMGGYWPSFNVPYFPDIQKAAGYSPGDWTGDKRHCLLSELQSTVKDMASMEAVIRHNDYKMDKCSMHDPCGGAVACRADLEIGAQMFGALDAKWASHSAVTQGGLAATAELGPTHDQQPVFCWHEHPLAAVPHHGHPDCYAFGPVVIAPDPDVPPAND